MTAAALLVNGGVRQHIFISTIYIWGGTHSVNDLDNSAFSAVLPATYHCGARKKSKED